MASKILMALLLLSCYPMPSKAGKDCHSDCVDANKFETTCCSSTCLIIPFDGVCGIDCSCKTDFCFHGDASVVTPSGPKKMRHVTAHDKVLTVGQDGLPAFEPVYLMAHAEPDRLAKFVRLATESGNELTLTPGHFVHVGKEGKLVEAKDVKVGDALLIVAENASYPLMSVVVRKREMALRGVYNPMTPGGAVVVDGVLASVYANDNEPISARGVHSLLWMVRQLVDNVPGLHAVAVGDGAEGMPAWLWAFKAARDSVTSVLSRG